jgi:Do/DeqQ family serine protease
MKHLKPALVLVAFVATVGITASQMSTDRAVAHAESLAETSNEIADVTAKVLPSVVSITTSQTARGYPSFGHPFGSPGQRRGLGSGVIVSSKGYVLTNNHVVANSEDITVILSTGKKVKAKLVGADAKADLAVLKLKKKIRGLKSLPFGSSSKLRLGEIVLAVGNPMGVGQSVTMGIVSAKGRANMGIVDYEDFIQTDAAINPGNSGGALINLKGELVGVPTAILSRSGGSQGIGFAIPSDMVKPIMGSLISNGKVSRGWLGVSIQDVNEELADALGLNVKSGVLIADVMDKAPAKRAGLKRGDVVRKVNGRTTRNATQLRNVIASAGAGKTVTLDLIRDGKATQLKVKLGDLPGTKGAIVAGKSTGKKAPLGVRVAPLSQRTRSAYAVPSDVRHGVVVTEVAPDSKAASYGLKTGDVILEVNRTKVKNASQFKKAYDKSKRHLALLLLRDGMTTYLVVTK